MARLDRHRSLQSTKRHLLIEAGAMTDLNLGIISKLAERYLINTSRCSRQ
jgi:hypothetical protein